MNCSRKAIIFLSLFSNLADTYGVYRCLRELPKQISLDPPYIVKKESGYRFAVDLTDMHSAYLLPLEH